VTEAIPIVPGASFRLRSSSGVLALDGEREVVLTEELPTIVTLSLGGPLVIDVPTVLRLAAEHGWFAAAGPASPRSVDSL